jgi:glycosyltransferase involved in cell wall biosynthesis
MASTFDKTRIEKERHGVVAMRGDLGTTLEAAGSAPERVPHDRRLKIAIDMRPLIIGSSGGIVQNLIGVFRELFSHYTEHDFFVYCTAFNRSLLSGSISPSKNVLIETLPVHGFFERLSPIIKEKDVDVLFRSYPAIEQIDINSSRQIAYIPDLQHEYFPDFFAPEDLAYRRRAFAQALGYYGAIGTISEFSRQTMEEHPQCRCPDFFLMQPALQVEHRSVALDGVTAEEAAKLPDTPFLFLPSNLWPHKNHRRILEAFRRLHAKLGGDISLILTGDPSGWSELAPMVADLPVRHLGFVRPELVSYLFHRASALPFFSLFEGFGIPMLEAFHAGTPVLCSNTTSMPEVGGDAVLMADPMDIEAMAEAMLTIARDDDLRRTLIERGRKRLELFRWDTSAHNLMAACMRVSRRAGEHGAAIMSREARPPLVSEARPPLVSIVTPSYNQGRFIRRTIESVLSQSYPFIEYVVVDGRSTDETVDILKSYGSRLKWISEEDRGQTHAINKGMDMVSGEIRAYLNSDDVLVPDAVAKAVRYFDQYPLCDMIYGRAHYIDVNDSVMGDYNTKPYSAAELINDCMICQPATFWRREIASIVGQFNEKLDYVMDYEYWLRMMNAGASIHHYPEILACSRLYPETKTLSARTAIYREIFDVCTEQCGFVSKSYFHGYWNHLCFERGPRLAHVMKHLPWLWPRLASAHRLWFFGCRGLLGNVVRAKLNLKLKLMAGQDSGLMRTVVRLTEPKPRKLSVKAVKAVDRSIAIAIPKARRAVWGVYPDNWTGPIVKIEGMFSTGPARLRMIGWTPRDMNVQIFTDGCQVLSRFLSTNRLETLEIDAPRDKDVNCLEFFFSDYFADTASRALSFRFIETNLFGERDYFLPHEYPIVRRYSRFLPSSWRRVGRRAKRRLPAPGSATIRS